MMRPFRAVLWVSAAIIVAGACIGAYRFGMAYLAVSRNVDVDVVTKVLANKAKISAALSGIASVSSIDVAQGFWLSYTDAQGNSHIFHFDIDALARANLTDDDIAALMDTVKSGAITRASQMQEIAQKDLPPALQFHNELYAFGQNASTSLQIESALQKKVDAKAASSDDLFKLSYVAELEGNYAKRDALNKQNCTQFKARCDSGARITIKGRILDAHGGIQGATVAVISRPEIKSVITDATGAYTISLSVKEMEKLRIRAGKRNYSEGFTDVVVLLKGGSVYTATDIRLEAPLTIVTIDDAKKTVTGIGNEYHPDGSVTIHTSRSTYEIPPHAIVDKSGRPYGAGPVDVYLYEFSKGNPPISLIQLDTFDQVMGYAGNLMKSFGMPYIQFFAQIDGTELDVLKSRPMVLTYTIADMEALRNGSDHIYRPLTDDDMQLLVAASQSGPYPVDRAFLIHNQLLAFPAFWVFDRKRGVWDNIGVSVLDVQGTIKTVFYTVRDDMH